VEDRCLAREFYPKAVMAFMTKESSPYSEKLQFAKKEDTGFTDKTIVSKQTLEKMQKMKQAMIEKDKKLGGVAEMKGESAAGATGKK
jgi:predicted aspartyl protease